MRISDCSSDVCSSDLAIAHPCFFDNNIGKAVEQDDASQTGEPDLDALYGVLFMAILHQERFLLRPGRRSISHSSPARERPSSLSAPATVDYKASKDNGNPYPPGSSRSVYPVPTAAQASLRRQR